MPETHQTVQATYSANLGEFEPAVKTALMQLQSDRIVERIWAHDHTVWKEDPAEITNRLGWLESPEKMKETLPEITQFVQEVREAGYTHALLLGMGGSSLAPEMFRNIHAVAQGCLDLSVLDSTDPGAVLTHVRRLNFSKTLFMVSTKSGGTVETLSFMKFFYNKVSEALGRHAAGAHFIAITDPGSSLESLARTLDFRRTFLNDPDIGGRYSALSYFGLVPAALIGMDLAMLLERATLMAKDCTAPADINPGALLGALIGAMARAGRDKLTLVSSPQIAPFGAWVEQLIAESTGKEGKGILPVHGETLLEPTVYSDDRLFVNLGLKGDNTYETELTALEQRGHIVIRIRLSDLYDLGKEIFRWEIATAIAGSILGINPFDQPNVESAKASARQMVAEYRKEGRLPEPQPTLEAEGVKVYTDFFAATLKETLNAFFSQANPGQPGMGGRSYTALQAYITPTPEADHLLQDLRSRIQVKYRMATTVGYGPRFLHSTGQLHKGDAGHGLFIQITGDSAEDVPIPDEAGSTTSTITFGTLKMAQALGDGKALMDAGRHVIRFHLGKDISKGLRLIADALA